MSARTLLLAERGALCDDFVRFGPDAPTLCEGWTTLDLAAHLVVRERDFRAGPGILLGGAFGRYTERLRLQAKARGYGALVDRLRRGAPWLHRTLLARSNVIEYWVHHEDVRRANGEGPRPDVPELDALFTRMLARLGRFYAHRLRPFGVEVVLSDASRHRIRRGTPVGVISGPVGECLLFLNGRRSAAQVELSGDTAAVAALRSTRLGV